MLKHALAPQKVRKGTFINSQNIHDFTIEPTFALYVTNFTTMSTVYSLKKAFINSKLADLPKSWGN
jgi:hypothetical protein